jgi:LysR family nod box-dependent transcriptional activator
MNLRQIDLNLLVALDALLTERNVTRAGERLSLSQSAMSGALAKLRLIFDDELLVRVGRKLVLTAYAEEIAAPVRQCLQQLEDLLNARRAFEPQVENRVFRIAATDYAVLLMLAPLVKRLAEIAPGISVQFVKLDTASRERMADGDIDFSIMPEGVEAGLPSMDLFKDPWVCILWDKHQSIGARLTLEEFMAQPHMAFNIGDEGHASVADEHLVRQGYRRNIVATTASFTNAPFLLQGTTMLTMVPRRLAERMREAARIRLLDIPVEVPPLAEKLIWNPRFTQSQPHQWMRGLLSEIAAAL